MQLLDSLERRIVAALQVDGRCSWRRMAEVLDEPERTVARKGSELLETGTVHISAIRPRSTAVIIGIQCAAGTIRATANAMASRRDSTFTYTMTGGLDCITEILTEADRMPSLLMDEVPGTVGLVRAVSYPVMRYFRTIRGWQPGVLSSAQVQAIRPGPAVDSVGLEAPQQLSATDERIVEALCQDGRITFERLARVAGVSDATARRRAEWLLHNNHVHLRAVVEPAVLGLPVEALLWIKCDPQNLESVGRQLAGSPQVRYAVSVAGDYQIVANVTARDPGQLYTSVTEGSWVADTRSVEMSLLLTAFKRGGRILGPAQGR